MATSVDSLRKLMGTPIRGHVAKVISTTALVINKGKSHGVEIGTVFKVLDPSTVSIKDPITGEELGGIDRTKVEVKVTQLQDKLSVAETFRTTRINVGGTAPDITKTFGGFQPPKYVDKRDTFKTDEETWDNLPEEKSKVKTGDPVVEDLNFK